MKSISVLIMILTLSGCAMSSQTYLPDGRQGYSIDCSGSMLNINVCYKKAADICQSNGYEIVNQNEVNAGYLTQGNAYSNSFGNTYINNQYGSANYQYGSNANIFSTPIINRTILIACKSPKKKTKNFSNLISSEQTDNTENLFSK